MKAKIQRRHDIHFYSSKGGSYANVAKVLLPLDIFLPFKTGRYRDYPFSIVATSSEERT